MNLVAAVLQGALQPYDWGRVDGLTEWTGRPTGGPEAELWFGSHPAAPSTVLSTVPSQRGGCPALASAPLLVKLLAAARPLSIQVHPSSATIASLRAAGRDELLADDAEKAEALLALERFQLLAGFRGTEDGARVLSALGEAEAAALWEQREVRRTVELLLSTSGPTGRETAPSPASVSSPGRWLSGLASLDGDERQVMEQVVAAHPDDPALAVAFLMQPHTLDAGDLVSVPVGVVHAYVNGLGVEVMACSDNVLRLGLTSKRVVVDAAVAALDLMAEPTVERAPEAGRYAAPAMPFDIVRLQASTAGSGTADVEVPPGSTAVCVRGHATLAVDDEVLTVGPGQAVLLARSASDRAKARLSADGLTVVALPRVS